MVETLARENTLLRSESMELRGLLDDSRDEQCDLRSAMMGAREAALPEEAEGAEDDEWEEGNDNDRPRRYSHASSAARSAVAAAPDAAALPEEEGAAGDLPSWASGASLVHSAARAADLSRTLSAGSGSDDPQSRRIGVGARPPPVTSASTGALGMGRRPGAGRGHSRRAMSMDVSSQVKSVRSMLRLCPRLQLGAGALTRPLTRSSSAAPRPRLGSSTRPQRVQPQSSAMRVRTSSLARGATTAPCRSPSARASSRSSPKTSPTAAPCRPSRARPARPTAGGRARRRPSRGSASGSPPRGPSSTGARGGPTRRSGRQPPAARTQGHRRPRRARHRRRPSSRRRRPGHRRRARAPALRSAARRRASDPRPPLHLPFTRPTHPQARPPRRWLSSAPAAQSSARRRSGS